MLSFILNSSDQPNNWNWNHQSKKCNIKWWIWKLLFLHLLQSEIVLIIQNWSLALTIIVYILILKQLL